MTTTHREIMRGASISLHSNLPPDVSSSEDEEDRLLREEEEEQERLLSSEHGEANEAPSSRSNNRKRANQQTDAEIADALNSSNKSSVSSSSNAQKKRRKMPTLDEKKLTSSKGLIFVRREFPTKLQYKDPKKVLTIMKKKRSKTSSRYSLELERKEFKRKQFELEVNASASYLSKLMKAYQNFALELAPNMHYKDTFNKIQDLGSKKQVRDYVNVMREEVCRDHLSKIYGRARAEKLLNELEHGLEAHKEKLLNDNDEFRPERINANDRPLNNLRAARNLGVLVQNRDDFDDSTTVVQKEKEVEIGKAKNDQGENKGSDFNTAKSIDASADGSDGEEEEALFDEVVAFTPPTKSAQVAREIIKNAFSSGAVTEANKEISHNESILGAMSKSNAIDTQEQVVPDQSQILTEPCASPRDTQSDLTEDTSQEIEETVTPVEESFSQNSVFEDITETNLSALQDVATETVDASSLPGSQSETPADTFSQEY